MSNYLETAYNAFKIESESILKTAEVFDKNGKVYGDADWNSLKLPSVKKMKEIL